MTFLEKLQAAGLPVIAADELGACSMGPMTPEQQKQFSDITLEHFQPSLYAELLTKRQYIQTLKDEYQTAVTRLQQIQNAGAIPFTQAGFAQVIQAIKDEANIIERLIKVLRNIVT